MNACIKSTLAACLLLCASHVMLASNSLESALDPACLCAGPAVLLTHVNLPTMGQEHLSQIQAAIFSLTVQTATQDMHFASAVPTWLAARAEENALIPVHERLTRRQKNTRNAAQKATRTYPVAKHVCDSAKTKKNRRYSERD